MLVHDTVAYQESDRLLILPLTIFDERLLVAADTCFLHTVIDLVVSIPSITATKVASLVPDIFITAAPTFSGQLLDIAL